MKRWVPETISSGYPTLKLRAAALIVLTGFVASVAYHYWKSAYQGLGYPASTYLYRADDRFDRAYPKLGWHIFTDFYTAWTHTNDPSPYIESSIFFSSNYFPFTHVVLAPFTWFPYPVAVKLYLLSIAAAAALFVFFAFRTADVLEDAKNVVVLAFTSYPVHFVLDRGNSEGLVFVFLALFVLCFAKDRDYLAAFFLACAGAMKMYPLLLGALFLQRKKFGPAAATAIWVAVLSAASILTFAHGFRENVTGLFDAMRVYGEQAPSGTHAIQHGSSLFGLFSIIEGKDVYGLSAIAGFLNQHYLIVAATLLVAILFVVWRYPLRLWETIAFLVSAIILLPHVSYDYKLIHVLLPLALFVRERVKDRYDGTILVMLALLLVPKGIPLGAADLTVSCVINPLLMLSIMLLCLNRQIDTRLDDGVQPA